MKKFVSLVSLLLFVSICSLQATAQSLGSVPNIPAPAFELPDLDDNLHKLSDYRGKPLIVNFWATWCPPCRKEMPSMERAWEKIESEGIGMVAINVGEDFDTIFGFSGEIDMSFPLLIDPTGKEPVRWPIRGLPTTYVINPKGEIVYQAIGGREWDDETLLDLVRALREE